jgi:hypothetical protein
VECAFGMTDDFKVWTVRQPYMLCGRNRYLLFMFYLMTLSVAHTIQRRMMGWLMNDIARMRRKGPWPN